MGTQSVQKYNNISKYHQLSEIEHRNSKDAVGIALLKPFSAELTVYLFKKGMLNMSNKHDHMDY